MVVHSTRLGYAIKVSEENKRIWIKEKRFEFFDNPESILTPLTDKTVSELKEIAKDMEGFKRSLNKTKLIKLIQNDLSNTK